MNKEQLTEVLQSCIFSFDGMNNEEILTYGFDEQLISLGEQLAIKLKKMEVKNKWNKKK